jgi:hypothetical protein
MGDGNSEFPKRFISNVYTQHVNMYRELKHHMYPYRRLTFSEDFDNLPETKTFLELCYNFESETITQQKICLRGKTISEVTISVSDKNVKVEFEILDTEPKVLIFRFKFSDTITFSVSDIDLTFFLGCYDIPMKYFSFEPEDLSAIKFN